MSLTPPGVAYWHLMPVICVLCKQTETTTAPSIRVKCVTLLQVVKAVKSGKYPFVMCNFAPPDMVGHTGVYDAAVVACAATGEQQFLCSLHVAMHDVRPLVLCVCTHE